MLQFIPWSTGILQKEIWMSPKLLTIFEVLLWISWLMKNQPYCVLAIYLPQILPWHTIIPGQQDQLWHILHCWRSSTRGEEVGCIYRHNIILTIVASYKKLGVELFSVFFSFNWKLRRHAHVKFNRKKNQIQIKFIKIYYLLNSWTLM